MWDEEFYNEPSEFEQQIYEFKQGLMNAVKDEYKEEMESLRKENTELQQVKNNLDQIKREYNQKVVELDMQRRTLKNEVRRERLLELMGDFKVELYRADWKRKDGPKCDKCDDTRRIHFESPTGRKMTEECTCKGSFKYYKPRLHVCSSFELRNGEFIAWYKPYRDTDGMEIECLGSLNVPRRFYCGESFENLPEYHYETYFTTEAECQAYCDWLTAKEVNTHE